MARRSDARESQNGAQLVLVEPAEVRLPAGALYGLSRPHRLRGGVQLDKDARAVSGPLDAVCDSPRFLGSCGRRELLLLQLQARRDVLVS